jgi:hypothetical protein
MSSKGKKRFCRHKKLNNQKKVEAETKKGIDECTVSRFMIIQGTPTGMKFAAS